MKEIGSRCFFFSFLALAFISCTLEEDSSSDELVVSIPAQDTIFRTITVKLDMSTYPPGTNYDLGKELYQANCTSCHHSTLTLTGPPLGIAWAKYEDDREFMYSYVRNAPELTASGNQKAITLGNWGPGVMLAFPSLNDTMINSILAYAEIEASKLE